MRSTRHLNVFRYCGMLAVCCCCVLQTPTALPNSSTVDGQHDFDFEFGAWSAHIRRLQHPLTGSTSWEEYDGSSVVRKVWDGRANLGELDVASQKSHIEGITLRLYNPQSHEWSISWASSRDGNLTPPLIGHFTAGRGEFYNSDTLEGKPIFARFVFSDIKPQSFRLEQAFSGDGGKTWETNWIATFTRSSNSESPADLSDALRSYDRAQVNNDTATLDGLVADDFFLVNSDSTTENKQQFLADFRLPGFKIDPYQVEQPMTKVYGDAALTAGLVHLHWTQDGKHQARTLRLSYVWRKQSGHWRTTYAQVTRVPE